MFTFTLDDVISAVKEVATEYPDLQYHGKESPIDPVRKMPAQYVTDDDEPDCLIGTALHKLGVPTRALSVYESKQASLVVSSLLDIHVDQAVICIEERQLNWLDSVQHYQDANYKWSDAVQMVGAIYE